MVRMMLMLAPRLQGTAAEWLIQNGGRLCAFLFSLIAALEDVRTRRVRCIWFLLAAAAGLLLLAAGGRRLQEVLPAFLPGCCLAGVWAGSVIVRTDRNKPGLLGLGDVLYYCVLALLMQAREVWQILWISLLLSAAFGLVMLTVRRTKQKKTGTQTLPYLAFTFLAVLISFMAEQPAG